MSAGTADSSAILYARVDDHVAIVTLNRPDKRNAVNGEMTRALAAAVRRAEDDDDVRVVILTSSSDKVFCAGADLGEVAAGRAAALSTPEGGFAGFVFQQRRKPWIAAVRGAVIAGGLELCLACEMIVASDDATFGLPEVKRSLVAGAGGVHRLPNRIPTAVAMEMIATGDPIDAARAAAIGLINRAVPVGEVSAAALALARAIAANAPLAVQEAVAVAREAPFVDDARGRALAAEALDRLRATADFREGPLAFVEKRAPVWQGR